MTETDNCGYDGGSYIYFQQGEVSIFFTPLIILDENLTNAEFIFTSWKS
jgi:hypothetical protein